MRVVFSSSFEKIAAIAVLGCLIGGACGAVTAPGAPKREQTPLVAVNRANKHDQLPITPTSTVHLKGPSLTAMTPEWRKGLPVGCDPAFSSIADPIHAHVYKRCAA
jgi:hypothetical protein